MSAERAPITPAQLSKLWAAARELGVYSQELHQLAAQRTGKTSLKALTSSEAAIVIDELVRRGASSGRRRRLPSDVPRLVSRWQQARIAECVQVLGWQDARPHVEGVIKRAIGRTAPRTSAEAQKVIEAFKAILRRRIGDQAPAEEEQQQ